jgi:hypothetical protein
MVKIFVNSSYIRKPFLIYDFAPEKENFVFFFNSVSLLSSPGRTKQSQILRCDGCPTPGRIGLIFKGFHGMILSQDVKG